MVLKHFYIDKAHPLSSPMVVQSLDIKNDHFCHRKNNKKNLGPKVPYVNAIDALMCLANYTRLERYSSVPTRRHWNGLKYIFYYLRGTIDMRLLYSKQSRPQLIGYADAGYLLDPHKACS